MCQTTDERLGGGSCVEALDRLASEASAVAMAGDAPRLGAWWALPALTEAVLQPPEQRSSGQP